ncbi:hypothetical protein J6590_069807 [Homalodisca vitripennis]|nr:hypothetical protein J6590_069807 [Homalodisca vitripennis]
MSRGTSRRCWRALDARTIKWSMNTNCSERVFHSFHCQQTSVGSRTDKQQAVALQSFASCHNTRLSTVVCTAPPLAVANRIANPARSPLYRQISLAPPFRKEVLTSVESRVGNSSFKSAFTKDVPQF